ncbi:MAG: hypothetical protein ACKO4Q_17765, partial [Planctomycetota bacterium]
MAPTEIAGVVELAAMLPPPDGGTSVNGTAALIPLTTTVPVALDEMMAAVVPDEITMLPPKLPAAGSPSSAEVLTSP